MTQRHGLRDKRSPNTLGWTFGIFSLIFCILCAGIFQIGGIYFQTRLAHKFISDLSFVVNHPVVEHSFKRLIDASKFLSNFPFLSDTRQRVITFDKASELFKILLILVGNEPQLASKKFDGWITSFSDEELTVPVFGEATLSKLEGEVKAYLGKHDQLREEKVLLVQLREDLKRIVFQHSLLAKDFAELFSLQTSYGKSDIEKKDTPELKIYKEGVLKDLPLVVGLKDGVIDLVELRQELQGVGGSVKTTSADPAKEFSDKLESMRIFSLDLIREYEKVLDQLSSTAASVSSLETGLKQARVTVVTTVRAILSTALEPHFFS